MKHPIFHSHREWKACYISAMHMVKCTVLGQKIFQLFRKSYINQKPLALSTAGKMQIECQLTNLKDSNVFAHDAIHRDNFGPSLW